ncbi:MAG: hypothetical protein ABI585_06445 [Betaproteobacteria bacterium]
MAGRSKTQANRRAARFIVRPLFAALCASGIVAPLASHAATIPVTTGGDAGTGATCTLRQAVESLNTATLVGTSCTNTGVFGSFDSVDLLAQAGTIALAGAAEIPISVDMQFSGPGATTLTISGANASRVFNISGPRAVGIDALTIANGLSAGPGGCIAGANAQLSLTGSVVTGCTALPDPLNLSFLDGLGGGIATYGVYLNHSTVSANTAANAGGGIWGKYITAYGSVVANNTVTGAACDIEAGGPFCVPTIFGGGGILTGAVQLINSTVSGNTVNASAFTSLNGEPPVPQTYLIGIGGGITHISKYDFEELALAKAGVTRGVFGNRDPAIRAAARAQAKGKFAAVRAKARSKIGGKGTLRNKADGYGYYILAMFGSTVSGNRVTGDKSAPGKYAGGGHRRGRQVLQQRDRQQHDLRQLARSRGGRQRRRGDLRGRRRADQQHDHR